MKIDITLIPAEVKELALKAANITNKLKTDLQSDIATDIAALFPGGGQLLTDAEALCSAASTACTKVADVAGSPAVQAIMQRLGSDLTMLAHDNEKHTISYYITAFEVVFHDLFSPAAA